MISGEPRANQDYDRVETNFSPIQGRPIKGFHLEGAALPDSPFVKRKEDAPAAFGIDENQVTHPIETGRPQVADEVVIEAVQGQTIREEVEL